MLLQRHHLRVCRKAHKTHTQAQRIFKTAPLYAVTNPEEAAPQSVLDAFAAFFESLWSPSTNPDGSTVQKAGMSYVYDEDGTLIAQTLTGGAQSSWGQSARYIYLPTASGPMPVAAIYGTKHYAIQSDHLNTPRRLIQSDGQVAWQWAYSAFGDEKPTTAKTRFANTDLNQSFGTTSVPAVTFNLRYPGQYFDQESNLHYNYHRSYSATTGRYTQADPIGLDGGWNRFGYVGQNPLSFSDVLGLTSIPYPVSPGISIPSIKPSPWMIPLIPLLIPGDTQRKCICRPATVENIRSVLNSSSLLSFQPSVSASHTQLMVTALDSGAVLPAIWVDGNANVDGNHRYIAGILCNTPTAQQPWQAPLTKRPIPFPLLKIVD